MKSGVVPKLRVTRPAFWSPPVTCSRALPLPSGGVPGPLTMLPNVVPSGCMKFQPFMDDGITTTVELAEELETLDADDPVPLEAAEDTDDEDTDEPVPDSEDELDTEDPVPLEAEEDERLDAADEDNDELDTACAKAVMPGWATDVSITHSVTAASDVYAEE